MARPRNQVPLALKPFLRHNPKSGYYEITYNKITYHLNLQQLDHIKQFFNDYSYTKVTPLDWYNQLSPIDRKQVKRSGLADSTEYYNDRDHIDY